jgi:hypothetical protein
MGDRGCTEVDVRLMLENATTHRKDIVEGRWVIETSFGRRRWDVIVEPDVAGRVLLVITAYPMSE